MSVIAALLREFPAAQKYESQLQALENENDRLKTNGEAAHYGLARRGRRYLRERGFLK